MGHAHTLNRLAEVPYAIFQSGATRPSEDAYDHPINRIDELLPWNVGRLSSLSLAA